MSGALSPNQIPSRFTHSPALIRIRGVRFAFLVRWKPEDAIVRFQGARPETIRAFHELDATLQKTLRLDRDDARKGCAGYLGHLFRNVANDNDYPSSRVRTTIWPLGRRTGYYLNHFKRDLAAREKHLINGEPTQ